MKKTTGERIKRISNIICIIMAFFCIAVGVVLYSYGISDGVILSQYLGLAIIPVGCLTFCLLNLILIGFAEIVDNSAKAAKYAKEASEVVTTESKELEDEIAKVKMAIELKNEEA